MTAPTMQDTSEQGALANDDIGIPTRLELYRLQVEIRDAEKRAYDLFLQNLVRAPAICRSVRRRSRRASPSL